MKIEDSNGAILLDETLPIEIKESVNRIVKTSQNLILREYQSTPFASLEWAIPTAIIIYLTKPFFEEFLKEAGKDTYQGLKKRFFEKKAKTQKKDWIEELANLSREIDMKIIVSDLSVKKQSNNNQTLSFSIFIETLTNKEVKFLFDKTQSQDKWEEAITILKALYSDHISNYPQDVLSKMLEEFNQEKNSDFFGIYSSKTDNWEFNDIDKIAKREFHTQKKRFLEKIRGLISLNKLLESIESLDKEVYDKNSKNVIILFKARYNSIVEEEIKGVLPSTEKELKFNILRNDVLTFLDTIEKEWEIKYSA